MRSTFCAPFDEEFARRCIMFAFPELKWDLTLQKSDPPDLADKNRNIGVEVVRAVTKEDAELANAYVQYSNESIENMPLQLRKKVDKGYSGFICDSENKIIGAKFSIKDNLYDVIKMQILRKTQILNSYRYNSFFTDCVFVYNSDGFCHKNGLMELMDELVLECKDYQKQFELLFIYCLHEIYLCDQERKTVECRRINDDETERMKKEALIELGRSKEYYNQSNFLFMDSTNK